MTTIPTPFFCASPDPCSCAGGGFDLYRPLCIAVNNNSSSTNTSTKMRDAKHEFSSLLDFLGDNVNTVVLSIGVIVLIGTTFSLVQLLIGLRKAKSEIAEVEQRAAELHEVNLKIRKQLRLTRLNPKQTAIIEANVGNLEREVPAMFKLDFRRLTFEERLGSGSFGDCFKGQ